MKACLARKRVALFVEEYFDAGQFYELLSLIYVSGARLTIVGSGSKSEFRALGGFLACADIDASGVSGSGFDAIIVPGGYAPIKMRECPSMVRMLQEASDHGRIIAAIETGVQLLISAEVVREQMVTCSNGVAVDARNAGAFTIDEPVVVDGNLITVRLTSALPEFMDMLSERLSHLDAGFRQPLIAGA